MTDYRELRFASAGGRLTLFARDYPGDSPDAPVLLLLHGLTRNSADFEPLAVHLAGRYRLLVPDQRGRGSSDYDDDPANYRPDIYAADMFALLDGLGVKHAAVIGTSMGGLMAMIMGAMEAARFSGIVFNDIGPVIEDEGLARITAYVGAGGPAASWEDAAQRCAAMNGDAFPGFTEADWMAFARRTCRETKEGRIEFAYDPQIAEGFVGEGEIAPEAMWQLWDAIDTVPVLVLRGATSDILAAETVTRMRRQHHGMFMSAELANRGHAPLLDEPEAITAIEEFLARITQADT